MNILSDLLGKDLAGYKLVEARFMELDHSLMGYYPAIFSTTKKEAIFVDQAVFEAALERMPKRRFKVHVTPYLLEPDGKGGFVVEGNEMHKRTRTQVYTKDELDKHTPLEWAPGLI